MSNATARPRIAWLVNLFGDPAAQHAHGAAMLRALVKKLDADVMPVYSLDSDADALKDIADADRPEYVRARLHALLGEHDLPMAEAIVMSESSGTSTADRAVALSSAVDEAGVLLTFVHSHAYGAVKRFVLGSFSESFAQSSSLPVLVLNPRAAVPESIGLIIFGTDLSDTAARAFNGLLPIARALGAQIRLEHQVTVREMSFFMQGEASRKQYDEELAASRLHCETSMKPLLVAAEAAGVPVTSAVEFENTATTPAEGLEERAGHDGASMICVPEQGGRYQQGHIGSTTLWLMRHATHPVLVMPVGKR